LAKKPITNTKDKNKIRKKLFCREYCNLNFLFAFTAVIP